VVIHKEAGRMITRPIGGTYRRHDPGTEHSLIERFLNDPKEVAEHNMLVDLERNDLSALCLPGSVQIQNFREVESYAHLHHLVSTISGTLKKNISLKEIIRAMLPGGSITGCPKARTMEWIDQLEPCFRGPYTGSFGTLHDNGDLHLNLIIRAMLILNERCYTQAGGGIVVNSTPEYEYQENHTKAQALLDLLK
jgi:anthranilate/para-aminobenzoate synthase component I